MEENTKHFKKRAIIMGIVVSLGFVLLSLRLYYIQFVRAEELSSGALNQRGREIILSPKRGTIYDRNNESLTNNEKVPTLIVLRGQLLDDKELYNTVEESTTLSSQEFKKIINGNDNLLMIPMVKDFKVKDSSKNLFLLDIVNRYTQDNLLSHVVGYINKSENRGQSGIEKVFDEYLNINSLDSFLIEYDKSRSMILDGSYNVNQDTDPNNPSGVKLTIDKDIQEIVENIIDKERLKGSVIVSEVETSNILAMISRPNFDQDNIQNYFNDESMALYNKAIQVGYPPGSIFKIVVLLTALEGNQDLIRDQYHCQGYEDINGIKISCSGKHGYISLEDGFAKSCNVVFIQLAQDLGVKKVIDMAKLLGFGQKINIGLLEESPGNLPKDNELYGAAVGNIAIGQGAIEVTPLQITNMMLTIANRGVDKPIRIIEGITNGQGYVLKEYNAETEKRVISEESAIESLNMMREVVKSGTGRHIDLEHLGGSGGKTGSAEGIINQRNTIHGWFTGYFPQKNPKYVITVLIEDAASGSRTAAPIFEKIIKGLSPQINNNYMY